MGDGEAVAVVAVDPLGAAVSGVVVIVLAVIQFSSHASCSGENTLDGEDRSLLAVEPPLTSLEFLSICESVAHSRNWEDWFLAAEVISSRVVKSSG